VPPTLLPVLLSLLLRYGQRLLLIESKRLFYFGAVDNRGLLARLSGTPTYSHNLVVLEIQSSFITLSMSVFE